jgi:hypothetical protein
MLLGGRAGQSAAAVSAQGLTINVQFAIKLSGPFRSAFGGPPPEAAAAAARVQGGSVWANPALFREKCKGLDAEVQKVTICKRVINVNLHAHHSP